MLRTILLIIGVLIILGIAFDGWRRKKRRLKLTRKTQTIIPEPLATEINEAVIASVELSDEAILLEDGIKTAESETDVQARAENNIMHLADKFNAEPTSGPIPVEIEPLQQTEDSANQTLPEKKSIKPEMIQSANQRIPKSVAPEKPKKEEAPINVISLTIMAMKSRPFAGYDIIRTLEDNNLHHGEFDIFHRHKYRNGKGPLYFSIASIVKPGTIDPRRVGELSTPGLALFMELDNPKHDRAVFKQALSTAHQIAKSLGGVVCDSQRVPLRESSLQSYAEKINL